MPLCSGGWRKGARSFIEASDPDAALILAAGGESFRRPPQQRGGPAGQPRERELRRWTFAAASLCSAIRPREVGACGSRALARGLPGCPVALRGPAHAANDGPACEHAVGRRGRRPAAAPAVSRPAQARRAMQNAPGFVGLWSACCLPPSRPSPAAALMDLTPRHDRATETRHLESSRLLTAQRTERRAQNIPREQHAERRGRHRAPARTALAAGPRHPYVRANASTARGPVEAAHFLRGPLGSCHPAPVTWLATPFPQAAPPPRARQAAHH